MATDPFLLDRIRQIMQSKNAHWTEKRMFGGDCFMVNDKMCFACIKDGLLARVGPDHIEQLVKRDGAEQMIHGGRVMTGYALVSPEAYDLDDDLEFWVMQCLAFNPKANSSRKKK